MKKKYIIIIPILLIVDFFSIINFVSAFNCNLIDFNSNKTVYYFDEKIKVNASWELYFNPINEIAYIQIHILDNLDQVIWNSTKYNQIGLCEENWTINFNDLDLDIINDSITLYIKFFLFYFQIDTTNTMFTYLDTIEIRILKRNINCELIGYKEMIKMGEILFLTAIFYENTSEIVHFLNNLSVQFFISFDELIILQNNYTTNTLGEIPIELYSLTQLKQGLNFLTFSITNNTVYNDTIFTYGVFVERNDLIIEIITFNDELRNNENFELKLHCLYYINQSLESLTNYTMLIKIFDNKTVYFIQEYTTDQFGILNILIAQNEFNYNQTTHNFYLSVFFNGTFMLENKTLIKSFKLILDTYPEITNSFQVRFLSFISILVVILVVFSYLITSKRSKNEKMLTELIIRY